MVPQRIAVLSLFEDGYLTYREAVRILNRIKTNLKPDSFEYNDNEYQFERDYVNVNWRESNLEYLKPF